MSTPAVDIDVTDLFSAPVPQCPDNDENGGRCARICTHHGPTSITVHYDAPTYKQKRDTQRWLLWCDECNRMLPAQRDNTAVNALALEHLRECGLHQVATARNRLGSDLGYARRILLLTADDWWDDDLLDKSLRRMVRDVETSTNGIIDHLWVLESDTAALAAAESARERGVRVTPVRTNYLRDRQYAISERDDRLVHDAPFGVLLARTDTAPGAEHDHNNAAITELATRLAASGSYVMTLSTNPAPLPAPSLDTAGLLAGAITTSAAPVAPGEEILPDADLVPVADLPSMGLRIV